MFFVCCELGIFTKKMQDGECTFSKSLKLFCRYEEENMSWVFFLLTAFLTILKLWQFLSLFYEVFYTD